MITHSTPMRRDGGERLRSLPRPIARIDHRLAERAIAASLATMILLGLVSIPFGLGIVEISGLAGTVAGLLACVVALVLTALGAISALIAEEGRRDGVVAPPIGWSHSGEPLIGVIDDHMQIAIVDDDGGSGPKKPSPPRGDVARPIHQPARAGGWEL